MTRLQIIWQIINHTPLWVWFVFGELLYIGIRALKPRTVHLAQLFIMPTIFFAMAMHSLWTAPVMTGVVLASFSVACAVGISAGLAMVKGQQLVIDKARMSIHLPGSSVTLMLVMIIFAAKYYFGYTAATHPEVTRTLAFQVMKFGLSGGWTGLAIGRLAFYVQSFRQAKS